VRRWTTRARSGASCRAGPAGLGATVLATTVLATTVLATTVLATTVLATTVLGSPPAGARSAPVDVGTAPGLRPPDVAALERAGAFGSHPVRLLLVGDSIALTLGMGLSVDARARYGVEVADHATMGCDLDPRSWIYVAGQAAPATQGCAAWRALWPFVVAAQRPQVVALGLGRWEAADHFFDGRWAHVGQPSWDQHLVGELDEAVSILHSFGARVVLFTMPYVDPTNRQRDGRPWPEDEPARIRDYNAVVRQVAQAHAGVVSVIDLNSMLSHHGVYAASIGGVAVRTQDGIHISVAGGELLRRQILPAVGRIGMEDEAAAGSAA